MFFSLNSIIIFSFCESFSSPDRMNKTIELKQFVLYMMYVWMLSSIFAIIVYTIDSYRRDADHGLKACLLDCKYRKKFLVYPNSRTVSSFESRDIPQCNKINGYSLCKCLQIKIVHVVHISIYRFG